VERVGWQENPAIKKPPRQRVVLRFPWRLLYLITDPIQEPERPFPALSALAAFVNRPQFDR